MTGIRNISQVERGVQQGCNLNIYNVLPMCQKDMSIIPFGMSFHKSSIFGVSFTLLNPITLWSKFE